MGRAGPTYRQASPLDGVIIVLSEKNQRNVMKISLLFESERTERMADEVEKEKQ